MASTQHLLRRATVDESRKRANIRVLLRVIAAAVVFLGAAGAWSVYAVTEYIEDHYHRLLGSILDGDIESLELWRDRKMKFVSIWATSPEVERHARELNAWHARQQPTREQLLAHDLQSSLREELALFVVPDDHTSYRVMTRGGLVLASSDDAVVGLTTNAKGMALLLPMFEGQPFISRPFGRGELLMDRAIPPGDFRILVGQAIRSVNATGVPDLFLVLRLDPEADFTRILTRGEAGKTSDEYAFDGSGCLLSESHFPLEQLQRLGLVPAGATTSIEMRLTDPGFQLNAGRPLPADAGTLPLTRMASHAIQGVDGFDVDGYRDYRGVEVTLLRWPAEDHRPRSAFSTTRTT